jgi:hypothetical protein
MNTFTNEIKNLFGSNDSIRVGLMTKTRVKTAAKHKELNLIKISSIVVELNKNSVYAEKVINTGLKNDNNADKVESLLDFTAQKSIYNHDDDCYCIMEKNGVEYLYCELKTSIPFYFLDDVEINKTDVAQYLTPSDSKKLLEPKTHVVNVGNMGIEHDVKIITPKLSSIQSIQLLDCDKVIKNPDFNLG